MAYGDEEYKNTRLRFAPPPETFPQREIDLGDRDAFALSKRGVCYLLAETLVDVCGPAPLFSSRIVQKVTGGDGLQTSASFEITFDPAHEHLVIHTASVLRDGVRREAASAAAFELLRRELNLERAMYDGRLTAHMIIPDVRVGDIVETAFSIVGANPALHGRLSQHFRLQWSAPTVETDCRLRAPEGRALAIQIRGAAPPALESVRDGVRELRWRIIDAPIYVYDTDTPASYVGHAQVHVADSMTWSDVADLFRSAYAAGELPSSLEDAIAEIARRFDVAEDRAVEALRYVQRLLRYHSIGVGTGGFRPRSIKDIWYSRYGDCKDASRLLVAILTRLGLNACPALVNTQIREGLSEALPYVTAFDHCIVRVEVNGQVCWLDPTCSPQFGRLSSLTRPPYKLGLPLTENAVLEDIPEADRKAICETWEHWTFGRKASDPAELKLKTIYRGWRADDMRRWRENEGADGVNLRMREGLESAYGELSELEPLIWIDEPATNELEVVERYSVHRPYAVNEGGDKGVRFESRDDVVGETLKSQYRPRREQPIDLGSPRTVRTERIFVFPIKTQIAPWQSWFEGPGVRGFSEFKWRDDYQARHLIEVDVERRIVPIESVQDYFVFLQKMRASNGVSFHLPTKAGRLKSASTGATSWKSWLLVIGLIAVFGGLRWMLLAT
ncbi:MAG: DUF3857 domain-containing protein [Brevundimonas sp.]